MIQLPRLSRLCAGLGLIATAAACTDGASPTASSRDAMVLAIQPKFHVASGQSAHPNALIQRARVTIIDSDAHDTISGPASIDVDASAATWSLPVSFQVSGTRRSIAAIVELLGIEGGSELQLWSGMTSHVPVNDAVAAPVLVEVNLYEGPPENLSVESMRIESPTEMMLEGDSARLVAHAVGSNRARIFWKVSDTAVARVDANGMLHSLRDGVIRVRAEAGRARDSVQIHVRARPFAVRATPDTVRVSSLGEEISFTGIVVDRRGNAVAGDSVSYRSDNEAVARPLGNGRFAAMSNGAAAIHMTSHTQPDVSHAAMLIVQQRVSSISSDDASFEFDAPGQSRGISVSAHDGRGNVMPDTPILWSTSDARVASVSPAGVVTAVAAGAAVISAVSPDGPSVTIPVTVRQRIASLSATVAHARIEALGDTMHATATARDAVGTVVAVQNVSWASSQTGVATVDSNGVIRAVGNGSARITASVDGISAFIDVTVQQAASSISVSPDSLVAETAGAQLTYTARVMDRRGNVIPAIAVHWSSADSTIVQSIGGGRFVARRNGSVVITAVAGDVGGGVSGNAAAVAGSARAVVRIPRGPVTVSVSPPNGRIIGLGTLQLDATVVNDTTGAGSGVTWTSSDASVATVDDHGLVTARAGGTVTITATSRFDSGAHATAVVVVEIIPRDPPSVSVSPAAATLRIGQNTQLTADVANDTTGPASGVSWTSSDQAVVTVDSTGMLTATGSGSAVVTATSRFYPIAMASAVVVVLPVTAVTMNTSSATMTIADTLRLTAAVTGTTDVTAAGVRYTSSNPAVALVEPLTGSVIALAAGSATITARAVADSAASATTTITVVPPAAVILSVLTDKGLPVDLNAVQGPIVVTAVITAVLNPIKRVETGIDSNVECATNFSPNINNGQGSATITCKIRTEDRSGPGRKYENGPHTIFVRAIDTNDVPYVTRLPIITNNN